MPNSSTDGAAARALAVDPEALSALLDGLPVFAYRSRWDGHWVVEYVSHGVEAITGRSVEDLLGTRTQSTNTIVIAEDQPRLWETVQQAVQNRRPYVVEYRIRTASGELRWLLDKGHGLYADGRLVGGEGVATDVTDRHRAAEERDALQAQLLQAQTMESVGRLAGGVAHDFNNLLTVILGYCDMLLEEDSGPGARPYLQQIRKAGERAQDLTRQLLAFSRRLVMQLRRVNLNRLLLEHYEMVTRLLHEDVTVQTDLAPDLGEINGDVAQLTQIVMNLAANARDAMGAGGVLTISTRNVEVARDPDLAATGPRPGPYVLMTISDTGCGMDAETQKHIFEPFFTTKGVGQGSGLGLPTVYGIVQQHGGHIDFESRTGQGTTFRIWLPRLTAAAVPGDGAKAELAPAGRSMETILLVDDDDGVREMAKAFLERQGYRVLSAASPSAALRLAAEPGPIDLLLSDVIMPETNGRDLHAQVLALRPGIKALFMSGYARDVLSREGHHAEGLRFVPKPFTAAALAARVREALGG